MSFFAFITYTVAHKFEATEMKVFYFALLLVVLPQEWISVLPSVQAQELPSSRAAEHDQENTNSLSQVNSADQTSASESPQLVCGSVSIWHKWLIDEVLRTVSELSAPNTFECCRLCQELPECQFWERNISSGVCILGRMNGPLAKGEPDVDGLISGMIDQRVPRVVLGAVKGKGVIRPCQVNAGIRYPRGIRIGQGRVFKAITCCNICRFSNNCRSWFHSTRTEACILNGNTPPSVAAANHFSGGTID